MRRRSKVECKNGAFNAAALAVYYLFMYVAVFTFMEL